MWYRGDNRRSTEKFHLVPSEHDGALGRNLFLCSLAAIRQFGSFTLFQIVAFTIPEKFAGRSGGIACFLFSLLSEFPTRLLNGLTRAAEVCSCGFNRADQVPGLRFGHHGINSRAAGSFVQLVHFGNGE